MAKHILVGKIGYICHFQIQNEKKMSLTIGGGTGFIGSSLTKLLTSKGYDVTIISRMPGLKRMTWHELDSNGIPDNTYAVVNLAGQNVLDPSRRWTPG